MKRGLVFATLAVLLLPFAAAANQELMSLQNDDGQWAIPGKNYSSTRYSSLGQITTANVAKLKQVWSFSTGALRGHEGQPLVVGTTMYVHSRVPQPRLRPRPDARKGAPIKWTYTPKQDERAVPVACCDLVHRGVNYAEGKILFDHAGRPGHRARRQHGQGSLEGQERRPAKGETMTMAGLVVKDKYIVGVSGGEFGMRGWVAAYDITDGKQAWKAYSMGPGRGHQARRRTSTRRTRTTARRAMGTKTWPGEQWKNGGGTHLGLVLVRSRAEPPLLLHREPGHLESRRRARATTSGR